MDRNIAFHASKFSIVAPANWLGHRILVRPDESFGLVREGSVAVVAVGLDRVCRDPGAGFGDAVNEGALWRNDVVAPVAWEVEDDLPMITVLTSSETWGAVSKVKGSRVQSLKREKDKRRTRAFKDKNRSNFFGTRPALDALSVIRRTIAISERDSQGTISSITRNGGFTFRPRVSGRFSPTRYAVAVRSMWHALSSDLLSPAFQCALSLHHLGPVERQTLVCHHPPSRLQTSLARSRWVRRFPTICFRLDSEWSTQAWRHFLHPSATFPTTCQ
jgi:hypothetical protein